MDKEINEAVCLYIRNPVKVWFYGLPVITTEKDPTKLMLATFGIRKILERVCKSN